MDMNMAMHLAMHLAMDTENDTNNNDIMMADKSNVTYCTHFDEIVMGYLNHHQHCNNSNIFTNTVNTSNMSNIVCICTFNC